MPQQHPNFDLLQAVDAGILLVDVKSSTILHANTKALELLGRNEAQIVGRQCHGLECLCTPDQAQPLALDQPLEPQERELLGRDGTPLPVLIAARPFNTPSGAVSILTFTDLTPLKWAEHKYASIFEHAVEGIFQSTPDGRFLTVNPALAEILGYDSPQQMVETLTDLRSQLYVDPADRDRLIEHLRLHGKVTNLECRFRRKDGGIRWISQAAREVRDEKGRLLYIEGLNIDITGRKEAEETVRDIEFSLRESEEKFRRTFDQSPLGAAMLTVDYTFVRANDAFCRITGYTEQELMEMTILDLTHPDDRADSMARAEQLVAGEADRYALDKRYIHRSGRVVWVHLSAGLVRDAKGRPLYYLPLVQDITDRKLAEASLATTKARLNTLLTSSPAVIYSRRTDGKHALTFISDNIADLAGFSPEHVLRTPGFWKSRLHPDDAETAAAEFQDQLIIGHGTREYRIRNAQGGYLWVRDQFRLVRDEAGLPVEIVGYLTDVTARRLIKQALEASEARYRAIIEDQTELVCRFTPDGSLTFVNEAYARFYGKTKQDFISTSFMLHVPEEDHEALLRHLHSLTPSHPEDGIELQLVMPDGSERWLQRNDRALFDALGNLLEYQSVGRDITQRVQAEHDLKRVAEEKERLRLNLEAVFRSIPDAIIVVDTKMNVLQTNRALTEVCCIGGEIGHGKPLHLVAGHCKRACFEVLSTTLKTREPVVEFRVECKGHAPGQTVVINSSPLLSPDNEFVGAVLVIRDITRLADLEKRLTDLHGHRGIIGKSKIMRDIYAVLDQLSEVESTVLVTGESGTGKELVAEALHYGGPRAKGPMIKVNCSALSESLLESELFGHVRGAFTGAIRDKQGRFEAAEGGTIFLDEIGDISPRIQLNLLRVLERKEYERVGDSKTRRANVRVIAATNVDLHDKIRKGEFREDLYYRLKVMVIHIPPLRDRTEDIPLLIDHFISQFRASFGKHFSRVSEEVMRIFMTHPWPGNVRELKYALEHACILCPGGDILPAHLPTELLDPTSWPAFKPAAPTGQGAAGTPRAKEPHEGRRPQGLSREAILETLSLTDNNRAKAARLLGVDRRTLYRNMEKFSIG